MSPRSVHILYERAVDGTPHGSAYIRLLRPFTHPSLHADLRVSSGLTYENQSVDAVIVDRLWRPDISPALAEGLAESVRRAGARLIYALDDNLLDLPPRRLPLVSPSEPWPTEDHLWIVRFFLRHADGVLVTTQALKERFLEFNQNIAIIPQALDERLLVAGDTYRGEALFRPRKKVIGYMGTFTHDEDLVMVLPALRTLCQRHPQEVEIQIIGVAGQPDTLQALQELPVRSVHPAPEEVDYPLFMLWFTSRVRWDIAISPLRDTAFNRCKSDIKFLDYSAIGAAGIYSAVPAYASTVRHGETGWLVENDAEAWIEALDTLLSDAGLRAQLAQNATRYLYAQRTLAQLAQHWLSALESLLDGP